MNDPDPRSTILVVEDEWLLGDYVGDILSEAGFSVRGPVRSVAEALDLLATDTIDCAALDVHLVDESSFPIAEYLALHGIPFFFMTGYTAADLPPQFQNRPMLSKPIDVAALKAMANGLSG